MSEPSPLVARYNVHADAHRPAILDEAGVHTYTALDVGARRVASALLEGRRSLEGERVALFLAPGAPFVEAFFGVVRAGGCAVVLSPLHPFAETAYVCTNARVAVLVAGEPYLARAAEVAEVVGARVLEVAEIMTRPAPAAILPSVGADAPALQLYTSGTTGRPKGAVLTHGNLGVQQALLEDAWGLSRDDVLLHALPLHHMHGLCIALLSCLGAGAAVRMLPSFDAAGVWEAMAQSTVLMAVPTMYAKLFAAFDAAPPATRTRWTSLARSLRLATSGSAALPVTLAERWRALTGEIPLERFGMTEVGVGLSNPLSGARRAGTVGLPLPTVKTRIVDEGGADAAVGELWIAGPSVFDHYFERDEESAAAFVWSDGLRWFKTGDTATREVDGYVRILGRTSVDILKSGGYKISALEIEEALRDHPAIAEVAVVGVPDETWGERVVACVVPREGQAHACGEAEVRAFARERLAPYKVPRAVVCMGALPRNAMGKVVKPELSRALTASGPRA